MNPSLTIDNSGRRLDGCYLGGLIVFWIIWAPATIWVTAMAISDFHIFWAVWLVFGYVGVLGIPYVMIQSRKPHRLEATDDALIVHGTGLPFTKVVKIPREQRIELHFGHYEDSNESESVATLNLISGNSLWTKRIMISPLMHPSEKRQIFRQIKAFLIDHGFNVEVVDDHPKSRGEDD